MPINELDRPARMPLAPRQPYIEARVQQLVHPVVTVEQPTCSDTNKVFYNNNNNKNDDSDVSNDEDCNDANINVTGSFRLHKVRLDP